MINIIVFLLFVIYLTWIWNSTRRFENILTRIMFIVIGTLVVALLTYILFLFSKIGIDYPKQEMIEDVRKMILLVFTPINGFAILPQLANLKERIKDGNISQEDKQKKIKIVSIIIIVLIIFECIYFKNIQSGIINYINIKQ